MWPSARLFLHILLLQGIPSLSKLPHPRAEKCMRFMLDVSKQFLKMVHTTPISKWLVVRQGGRNMCSDGPLNTLDHIPGKDGWEHLKTFLCTILLGKFLWLTHLAQFTFLSQPIRRNHWWGNSGYYHSSQSNVGWFEGLEWRLVFGGWTTTGLMTAVPRSTLIASCIMYFWCVFCCYMLIVSLNAKGQRYPRKRSRICDFLKMYAIDIVLLQETKTAFSSDSFLRWIGGSSLRGCRHLNSLRVSCGQIIGWRDNVFDCYGEVVGEFLLGSRGILTSVGLTFSRPHIPRH